MPNNYIKNLSTKYNVSVNALEDVWSDAKNKVENQNDKNYWPKVVHVFKNMIKSKYNINENLDFHNFINLTNENYEEQEEMPTKKLQQDNIKDKI